MVEGEDRSFTTMSGFVDVANIFKTKGLHIRVSY